MDNKKNKKKKNRKKEQNSKKNFYYIILGIIAVILTSIVAVYGAGVMKKYEDMEIAYTDLIKKIDNDEVEKIEMTVGSTTLKVTLAGEEEENKQLTKKVRV